MPRPTSDQTILQASFFWKNDRPGGIGFTFGPPSFDPNELAVLFAGEDLTKFLAASDESLGTNTVATYLAQLEALAQKPKTRITIPQAVLIAYNIIWLVERGFIPNDEYNGYQFVTTT